MTDFGLLVARYNSSLPTLTDGQLNTLQVDSNGRLLVQADVTVLVDFLGLNGAANNANILIVGTEDGTSGGTPHAVKLASDGAMMINDNGGSITVDASDLDIRDLAFATDKVDVTGSLVDVQATDLDIRDLSHTQDSVKVGDGTDFLAVNADGSLNITDNGGSLTVDATDLDIRDLDFAQDSVDVSNSTNVGVVATDFDIRDLSHTQDSVKIGDGTDFLSVNADGSLNITDNGGSLTVDATDLDIRDLDAAQDNVAISDGTDTLAINADGSLNITDNGGSLTVDATDLDIRDLSHSQDSVKIGDGTDFLAVNADGSLNVVSAPPGSEEYVATDALAANADGLVTITASGTPWVDVATFSHTSGVAYIFGYEWTCDANANARLITDDGANIVVYKHSLNSSAMPTMVSHFAEGGRLEIAGAAGLSIKLQVKKRSATAGDALGHGSVHIRK